jgi:hypothetical protein
MTFGRPGQRLDHKDYRQKEVEMQTASYWSATHSFPAFPAIDRDIEVDVVVVGAGLTGITAAYLLKQEGARVALIERDRIAAGDTGRTIVHLTYVTDKRLHKLVDTFGHDATKAFWEGRRCRDRCDRSNCPPDSSGLWISLTPLVSKWSGAGYRDECCKESVL